LIVFAGPQSEQPRKCYVGLWPFALLTQINKRCPTVCKIGTKPSPAANTVLIPGAMSGLGTTGPIRMGLCVRLPSASMNGACNGSSVSSSRQPN